VYASSLFGASAVKWTPTGDDGLRDDDFRPREEWLLERIKHERRVYYGAPPGGACDAGLSLQQSFDRERAALLAVQVLAVGVVRLALARLL
jgi:ADP-ribose pyrophosphatase YjhB (NUDIX family)